MTQTIPQPVLDVIATYCKTSNANILPIIEHAIRDYAGGNPVRTNKYAEAIVRAILHNIDPDMLGVFVDTMRMYTGANTPVPAANPVLMMQAQAMTPVPAQPASTSPHAPRKRNGPKLPYWFKVVTSVDKKTKNGYGLKGKFINPADMHKEQHGRIVVCQMKDFKTKAIMLYVLDVDASANTVLNTPSGSQITVPANLLVSLNNYDDLFSFLVKNCRIPS